MKKQWASLALRAIVVLTGLQVPAQAQPVDGAIAAKAESEDGSVNLRASADLKAAVVATIPSGAALWVVPVDADWLRAFTQNGVAGWVKRSRIRIANSEGRPPIPGAVVAAVEGEDGQVNVRSTRDINGPVGAVVLNGGVVWAVPGNDDWSRVVTLQGVSGWIKRSRLRFGSRASDSALRSEATPVPGGGGDVNSLGMKMVPVPGTKILMATTEVTVDQYRAAGLGYESPSFPQSGNHPAVNVSWNDAKNYCAWLSQKEGEAYRLPTDWEWSCAVGLGNLESAGGGPEGKDGKFENVFPWGSGKPSGRAGNYMGQEWKSSEAGIAYLKTEGVMEGRCSLVPDYNDGCVFTSPVGGYAPNRLGIYDLGGNASEWCGDKYGPSMQWQVLRGGSWIASERRNLLSSCRSGLFPAERKVWVGFRVVCESR